ncbi:MAG: MBL fold metallo-hydrolase [Proteobacteria bacterium]|nr:MBL fold metallo-hydrolase [Pseudomonadota bacterium]
MTTRRHGASSGRLVFLGAAGTVTGSCYLLERGDARVLIDCGLFQGSKSLKALNYGVFPVDPRTVHAVLLTHAHIDHSGLIPKLFNHGYRGLVHATAATRDLLSCMLPDCGHIQEYEVEQLNRRRRQRGEPPVEPIYTQHQAEACLSRIKSVSYDAWFAAAPGIRARFWDAGHMLGSASVEIELASADRAPVRLLFSGDLGNQDKSLHAGAGAPSGVDYAIVEATYGGRARPRVAPEQRRALLSRELDQALGLGGNVVIPVFAVERAQELLFDLGVLHAAGRLPHCEIFLDSPLAVRSTEIFERYRSTLGEAAGLEHPFRPANVHFVGNVEDSRRLNRIRSGAVILAASGMCEAGRVRHHLKHNLWRAESTVLLVGHQASGTLGRILLDGAMAVQIMGEAVRIRARIRMLDVYSAHPDHNGLVRWIGERAPIRRAIVLTHGETAAIDALARELMRALPGCPAVLQPALGATLALDGAATPTLEPGTPRLAEPGAAAADWHNAYADLRLRLDAAVRGAPDERSREALIGRVRAMLADSPGA